jgi:ABC-type polar amino acid transport system ATPase subunit
MEENTGNTENKKTKVMIIGHVDHGKTTLTAAMMKAMEVHKDDIIIVGAEGAELANIKKEDPFDNTPKFVIKPYDLEPLREPFIDYSQNNPWPSPKGRKGKRRW